jgi:hypothetical protein
MSIAGVSSETIGILGSVYSVPWVFHLGFLFSFPLLAQLIYDGGILYGMLKWLDNIILGSIYYLFRMYNSYLRQPTLHVISFI